MQNFTRHLRLFFVQHPVSTQFRPAGPKIEFSTLMDVTQCLKYTNFSCTIFKKLHITFKHKTNTSQSTAIQKVPSLREVSLILPSCSCLQHHTDRNNKQVTTTLTDSFWHTITNFACGHHRRQHQTSHLHDCPLSPTERFPSPRHEHGTVCQLKLLNKIPCKPSNPN